MSTIDDLRTVLIDTLELSQRPEDLQPQTALFGAMPELDSFGVIQLVAAVESRFDITISDDEFGEDLFETVGTLAAFIEEKLAG